METSVNNKCKAFTSLEQSKKLAEILPLESADCYWEDDISVEFGHGWHPQHIPCWSLAALIDVLPNDCFVHKEEEGKFVAFYLTSGECGSYVKTNPIDACYEIILELHERKML